MNEDRERQVKRVKINGVWYGSAGEGRNGQIYVFAGIPHIVHPTLSCHCIRVPDIGFPDKKLFVDFKPLLSQRYNDFSPGNIPDLIRATKFDKISMLFVGPLYGFSNYKEFRDQIVSEFLYSENCEGFEYHLFSYWTNGTMFERPVTTMFRYDGGMDVMPVELTESVLEKKGIDIQKTLAIYDAASKFNDWEDTETWYPDWLKKELNRPVPISRDPAKMLEIVHV